MSQFAVRSGKALVHNMMSDFRLLVIAWYEHITGDMQYFVVKCLFCKFLRIFIASQSFPYVID